MVLTGSYILFYFSTYILYAIYIPKMKYNALISREHVLKVKFNAFISRKQSTYSYLLHIYNHRNFTYQRYINQEHNTATLFGPTWFFTSLHLSCFIQNTHRQNTKQRSVFLFSLDTMHLPIRYISQTRPISSSITSDNDSLIRFAYRPLA